MLLTKSLQSRLAQAAVARTCQPALFKMQTPQRGYFSFMDKLRDRFNTPLRHIKSFVEPDGINYQT